MMYLVAWSKLVTPRTLLVHHLDMAEIEAPDAQRACEQVLDLARSQKADYLQAQKLTVRHIRGELRKLRGPNEWFRITESGLEFIPEKPSASDHGLGLEFFAEKPKS